MKTQKMQHTSIPPRRNRLLRSRSSYVLLALLGCLLLLSACSDTPTTSATNNSVTQTPIVPSNPALRDQSQGQLDTLKEWVALLKQYGGDTTSYQQKYDQDQQNFQKAQSDQDYQNLLKDLNGHVNEVQIPALDAQAISLQKEYSAAVSTWSNAHIYHNPGDNVDYPLGYEYGADGIGWWIQDYLTRAKDVADYQYVIYLLQTSKTNFEAMKSNFDDQTAGDQLHQKDIDLLHTYEQDNGHALVVSLEEQVLRAYDKGKLVKVIPVTTGQPDLPTIPGKWWIESLEQDITFHAEGTPETNPHWYEPTHINVGMQFHSAGYYIHDSWWRAVYGKGSQFPHPDPSGATRGSHGCVNMTTDNSHWVLDFVKLYTAVIVY